jgi:hypothetical protein
MRFISKALLSSLFLHQILTLERDTHLKKKSTVSSFRSIVKVSDKHPSHSVTFFFADSNISVMLSFHSHVTDQTNNEGKGFNTHFFQMDFSSHFIIIMDASQDDKTSL